VKSVFFGAAGFLFLTACAVPAPKTTHRPAPSVRTAVPPSPPPRPPVPALVRAGPPRAETPPEVVLPPPEPPPAGLALLSPLPNLNDFTLLANGGWNANWYVGHNTCWVHRLPPAPRGDYRRAFVGAKLGAMKTEPIPSRPTWERRPISGEVSVGVSPEPLWPQSRRYLLTAAEDIPLEGDPDNALDGVGEARWFWVEIPLKAVSFDSPNYVALYSPDDALRDARHAPILAAGPSNGVVDTWLNNGVRGAPPLTAAEALKTPVVSYEPAVAIKLIPAQEDRPQVSWRNPPAAGAEVNPRLIVEAEVVGADVQYAWVEFSTDTRRWLPLGRPQWGAPYTFTLSREALPRGNVQVRAAAKDFWESIGTTAPLSLKVPRK